MGKSPQSLKSLRAMGGARRLSALLAAALCAALLAACGGGGDDSTATTSAGQTTANGPTAGVNGDGGSKQDGKSGGKDGSKSGSKGANGSNGSNGGGSGNSGGSGSGGGSNGGGSGGGGNSSVGASFHFAGKPTKHDHPAPVEGQRSDVFRVPGGDNSIQEFGSEQDSGERTAAMQPIAALYKALATGDWSEVCATYLSSGNVEQIKQLAEQSPQMKGKDCSAILSGLTGGRPSETPPDTPDGGLVSFRTEGDTGFAIYWGIDGKGYAFALKSEGGAWKLTALAPTPLTP
jgi:hypothetical protein